jgi:HAAS
MNDTTVMGAAEQAQDVRAYVAAVRAWLADLPADEVEDLTAGMEADLAERAAESGGTLGALLGEPEAYAAELRSAAGLPPRSASVVADAAPPREPWTDRLAREGHELVARQPWLRELRPTWWLVRGAVAGWVVASVLGTGRVLALPLIGAALSLWLGLVLRRREPLGAGPRFSLGAGNALAVLLLLPMLAFYTSGSSGYDDSAVADPGYPPTVVANGEPVENLYAYDAAGNRLDGVRLYDQNGRPLTVGLDAPR